jgi:hypothetical protein
LSLTFDVRTIFILHLCFLRLKPATFCLMKNRDCPVNIFSTVLSLLPDPY